MAESMLVFHQRVLALRRPLSGSLPNDFRWCPAPEGVLVYERGPFRVAVNFLARPVELSSHGRLLIATIARIILEEKKTNEKLELRGIFFDGDVYAGDKGVEQVSKLPTREEAIGMIVASLMGPGRKLASALKGPGGTLGAILKTIEDKAKEKEGAPAPQATPA